jgi:hypothetical protein
VVEISMEPVLTIVWKKLSGVSEMVPFSSDVHSSSRVSPLEMKQISKLRIFLLGIEKYGTDFSRF